MSSHTIGLQAKEAAIELRQLSHGQINQLIRELAQALLQNKEDILKANQKDMEQAMANGLPAALSDRLLLDENRLENLAQATREIAAQPDVLGQIVSEQTRSDGLVIQKQRIPLGVIGMIFESRPNVVIDAAALCIKSGNALILKGGKEANHSNKILGELLAKIPGLPAGSIQVLDSTDRSLVAELLQLNQFIDVIIPRGGQGLIDYVYQNATMPVIAHFQGLCHIYVHLDGDLKKAEEIILNAKCSRPGVCNAMESLLLHKDLPPDFISGLCQRLVKEGVQLRGCPETRKHCPQAALATEQDYATEYLDKVLSIKIVDSLSGATTHIHKYGSHHTEGIITSDPTVAQQFIQAVDASCISVNASTRFNDGGELGLGAEMGISTTKLHAYGPMGAAELTTSRYLVLGDGHVR